MATLFNKVIQLFGGGDEEAMWRLSTQNDQQSFAELMNRWERPVHDLCYRMTGDHQKAEDLKQEAFTRVYLKRAEYRKGAKFSTWIWQIALNLCHDDFRKCSRRIELSLCDEDGNPQFQEISSAPGPDGQTITNEEGALVRQALMQLPEIYRSVLVLRHYENLKLKEIAEVLQIPEGTVNSRMAEALSQMAVLLAAQKCVATPSSNTDLKERLVL